MKLKLKLKLLVLMLVLSFSAVAADTQALANLVILKNSITNLIHTDVVLSSRNVIVTEVKLTPSSAGKFIGTISISEGTNTINLNVELPNDPNVGDRWKTDTTAFWVFPDTLRLQISKAIINALGTN